jgi:hypothetical protein
MTSRSPEREAFRAYARALRRHHSQPGSTVNYGVRMSRAEVLKRLLFFVGFMLLMGLLLSWVFDVKVKPCTHRYVFADGPADVPCGSALDDAMGGGR